MQRSNKTTKSWRRRASIPLPHACKACALPFELHPLATASTRFAASCEDWQIFDIYTFDCKILCLRDTAVLVLPIKTCGVSTTTWYK